MPNNIHSHTIWLVILLQYYFTFIFSLHSIQHDVWNGLNGNHGGSFQIMDLSISLKKMLIKWKRFLMEYLKTKKTTVIGDKIIVT